MSNQTENPRGRKVVVRPELIERLRSWRGGMLERIARGNAISLAYQHGVISREEWAEQINRLRCEEGLPPLNFDEVPENAHTTASS